MPEVSETQGLVAKGSECLPVAESAKMTPWRVMVELKRHDFATGEAKK